MMVYCMAMAVFLSFYQRLHEGDALLKSHDAKTTLRQAVLAS